MRKLIILISLLACGFIAEAQSISFRSSDVITVADARWMGLKNCFIPRYADTTAANLQKGIDSAGAIIYTYNTNSLWFRQSSPKKWVVVGATSGTITGAGNLSPLFTTGVSGANITFALTNTTAFTLYGRASGTGAPSFLAQIDSNFIPTLHSEAYYNTKYAPASATGTVTSIAIAFGTSGTDINVTGSPVTTSGTITLNVPSASATARGVITTSSQTFAGAKTFNNIASYALNLGGSFTARSLVDKGYVDSIAAIVDTVRVLNKGATGLNSIFATTGAHDTIWGKRWIAGTNITLTQNADSSITVSATGGGSSYTFSTGLTDAASTITNNVVTGVSSQGVWTGSTSTSFGTTIRATSGNAGAGANIYMTTGNAGADTALKVFPNTHITVGTNVDVGAQFYVRGATKLLFDNALHVWDIVIIDSSGFLKRLPIGANGKFVGVQGDTLAYVTGGLTNSNVGAAYRAAIPGTNNIKTFAAGTGITIDSATTNVLTITGTTINTNAAGRFVLGSGTANTLNATTQFTLIGGNELKFISSAGDGYITVSTTGDPSNPSYFYFANTDIQVFAHNLLVASFNGTTAKTYLQSEGSFGAKSFTGSTTDLQMDNTFTEYTFNGSTDKTWFVPAIATANNNRWYIVRNIGSDTLTLSDPGASPSIYTNTAVVSVIIPPGGGYLLYSNSTSWITLKFVNPNIDPAYGTYTPTLTNQTNVGASTAYQCQYLRVGNSITVSGKVDIDPTTTGATELRLTLPFAPGFANDFEAGGAANSAAVAGESAAISAVSGGGNVAIKFIAVDLTNKSYFFTVTYKYTAP